MPHTFQPSASKSSCFLIHPLASVYGYALLDFIGIPGAAFKGNGCSRIAWFAIVLGFCSRPCTCLPFSDFTAWSIHQVRHRISLWPLNQSGRRDATACTDISLPPIIRERLGIFSSPPLMRVATHVYFEQYGYHVINPPVVP